MALIDLFSPRKQTTADMLADQVDTLRRELRRMSRQVAGQAGLTADDLSEAALDFGREAARRGAHFAGVASRQALRAGDAVRRDPLPAVAIVGTALLVSILLSRR